MGRRARERRTIYHYPAGTITNAGSPEKLVEYQTSWFVYKFPQRFFALLAWHQEKADVPLRTSAFGPLLGFHLGSRLSWMCTLLYLLPRYRAGYPRCEPYIVGKRAKGL